MLKQKKNGPHDVTCLRYHERLYSGIQGYRHLLTFAD